MARCCMTKRETSAVYRVRGLQEDETVKILIAAASFSSHISGVQRHAFNIVRCLLRQPEISTVHLVVAPK